MELLSSGDGCNLVQFSEAAWIAGTGCFSFAIAEGGPFQMLGAITADAQRQRTLPQGAYQHL